MNTKTKNVFQIVANVSFVIPSLLKGAWNAHHKARLQRAQGEAGKGIVTTAGAAFFSNRARLDDAQLKAEAEKYGYTLYTHPAGFQWAENKYKSQWENGNGALGQSLFANAISTLTQQAHAASVAAKAKTTATKPAATKAKKAAMVKAK